MRALVICVLLPMAFCGCDRDRYDYVVRYQEYAHASLDEGGRRVFLTARATFVDETPAAADQEGLVRGGRDLTADDRTRYAVEHPETFGPIHSREEFEEQFGDGPARGASAVEIVISGNHAAEFTVDPGKAALSRGGLHWTALESGLVRLAVGGRSRDPDLYDEGAPATIPFPALPEVSISRERLTAWQIQWRAKPVAEPLELSVTLESQGRPRVVVFRFERVAEYPLLPPNPLYRLYAAH
jgi:hypothetical protein